MLADVVEDSQVWMSHSDTITQLPEGFELLATTASIPVAAFTKQSTVNGQQSTGFPLYGLQFHPEVYHSTEGKKIIKEFSSKYLRLQTGLDAFIFYYRKQLTHLKKQIGDAHVIMALSGGVDSTVAATLISKAIGRKVAWNFC